MVVDQLWDEVFEAALRLQNRLDESRADCGAPELWLRVDAAREQCRLYAVEMMKKSPRELIGLAVDKGANQKGLRMAHEYAKLVLEVAHDRRLKRYADASTQPGLQKAE